MSDIATTFTDKPAEIGGRYGLSRDEGMAGLRSLDPDYSGIIRNLGERARDLKGSLEEIGQASRLLKNSIRAMRRISLLIDEALIVTSMAKTIPDRPSRKIFASAYDDVIYRLDHIVEKAAFQSQNLLKGEKVVIGFFEDSTVQLEIPGTDYRSSGLNVYLSQNAFADNLDINTSEMQLNAALNTLKPQLAAYEMFLGSIQNKSRTTHLLVNKLDKCATILGTILGNGKNAIHSGDTCDIERKSELIANRRDEIGDVAAATAAAVDAKADDHGEDRDRNVSWLFESLHSIAVDLVRFIDQESFPRLWSAYEEGDHAVFTRRLRQMGDEEREQQIGELYKGTPEFHEHANRYFVKFNSIIKNATDNKGNKRMLIDTYLSSQVGQVYVMLAKACGHIGGH